MKHFLSLCVIACLLCVSTVKAQQPAGQPVPQKAVGHNLKPVFNRSVGLSLGTQGLGFEAQHPLPYAFNLRLGASILPDFKASGVYTLNSYKTNIKASTSSFWNAHLMMDFQPFNSTKSAFRKLVLTTGAAYFPKAKGTAVVKFGQDYKYGDMTFTGDEVGQITTVSSWAGFAPYMGLGINNLVSKNKYNMNLALGTYYMEAPQVTITGTNMLSGNSSNSASLQKNMEDYRWLPVLQLNFNYNL